MRRTIVIAIVLLSYSGWFDSGATLARELQYLATRGDHLDGFAVCRRGSCKVESVPAAPYVFGKKRR